MDFMSNDTGGTSLDFSTPLAAERIFPSASSSSGRFDPRRMSNTPAVKPPLRPRIRRKSLARSWLAGVFAVSPGKTLRLEQAIPPRRTAQGSRKIQARILLATAFAIFATAVTVADEPQTIPPLAAGETLRSETVRIDAGGTLTYTRTISRQVAFLGMEVRTVNREAADRLRVTPFQGVRVVSVEKGGPAALAGLIRDDVVIRYAEEPIHSPEQFSFILDQTPPGSTVAVDALRDREGRQFAVKLGTQTRVSASRAYTRSLSTHNDRDRTGMVLAEVTPEIANEFAGIGLNCPSLVIADILPGGPAFFSEARRNDLVVEANGKPVASLKDFIETAGALKPASDLKLGLLRRGTRVDTAITVQEDATRRRQFHFPLHIVSYEKRPEKKSFLLLWGILYSSAREYRVQEKSPEHVSESEVSFLLHLFQFESSPRRKKMRLLWLFPITFSSGSDA